MRSYVIIITILATCLFYPTDSQLRAERSVRGYEPHPTAEESRRLRVEVNGEAVFTERLPVREGDVSYDFPGAEKLSYHCARFSFTQEARVRVSVEGGFSHYTLRPGNAEITPDVSGNTIALTMKEPANLLLEVDSSWLYLFADPLEEEAPHPGSRERKVVNIMDYEVDSTGKQLSTFPIQRAIIDVATGPEPGGVLYFPRGTYKTGTIRLYSGVTIYLTEGALLQASLDPEDFPLPFGTEYGPPGRDHGYEYALIQIHHAQNVGILGRGTIDGGGAANGRLKIIHMENSKNVVVEDVVVRNGEGWMCPILYCEKVLFRNVRVISSITSNTDGINPDSSVEVEINGCFVCSGDDPLVVKATNFGLWLREEMGGIRVVNNVVLTMKSALKIGTETRARRMADVLFENNDILYSDRAFTVYIRDGAAVENVVFRNNRVEVPGGLRDDRNRILDIEIDQRDEAIWQHPRWEEVKHNPGTLRNVVFEDISVSTSESEYLGTSQITGYDQKKNVENVTFRNFRINGRHIVGPEDRITAGITNASFPWLQIDEEMVRNVVFE